MRRITKIDIRGATITDHKKMPDYGCGKVYAIVGEDGLEIYVGSTAQPLHKRWHGHKKMAKFKPERAIYKHIAENGGFEKFRIILVEEYPCENRQQLLRREGEHIKRLQPIGNRRVAGRTPQEWIEEHKDMVAEYMSEYREQNRDKLTEQKREYYEQNKDKIAKQKREYREQNKDKTAEYRERNRDKLTEYMRVYYEQNKDKIAEQKREYREQNKDKTAEYREQNKDKIAEYGRVYYEQNKDKLVERMRVYYLRKKAEKEAQASTSAQ
jgi:hypothetical protein